MLAAAIGMGSLMLAVDGYATFSAGEVDRRLMEQYFDQAEYWLNSPTAHVVKVVTFGYVNPRRMVADEVRKALVAASNVLNTSLWWWNVQIALPGLTGTSHFYDSVAQVGGSDFVIVVTCIPSVIPVP